jgi:hypothetical protein
MSFDSHFCVCVHVYVRVCVCVGGGRGLEEQSFQGYSQLHKDKIRYTNQI